jgi:hypothetical protein
MRKIFVGAIREMFSYVLGWIYIFFYIDFSFSNIFQSNDLNITINLKKHKLITQIRTINNLKPPK